MLCSSLVDDARGIESPLRSAILTRSCIANKKNTRGIVQYGSLAYRGEARGMQAVEVLLTEAVTCRRVGLRVLRRSKRKKSGQDVCQ